jgi:hypothetical protein
MANTWKDTAGREWTVRLNCGNTRKLRDELSVDLLDPSKADTVTGLLVDLPQLCLVLWQLCAGQAKARCVTRDNFFEALDGDALAAGWDALRGAFVDFCPAPRRQVVEQYLVRQAEAMEQIVKAATEAVQSPGYRAILRSQVEAGTAELIASLRESKSANHSGK